MLYHFVACESLSWPRGAPLEPDEWIVCSAAKELSYYDCPSTFLDFKPDFRTIFWAARPQYCTMQ